MSPVEIAAGLAVLAGALLQSAVGFGFSLICAPLVFAAAPRPEEAVGLLLLLGLEVNLLTLVGERRRVSFLGREVVMLLAWSVPGMVLGVVVLRALDAAALQIVVTAAVFFGLAVQRWMVVRTAGMEEGAPFGAESPIAPRPVAAWAAPLAGAAAGALNTSVTASGPPLVLYLRGRGIPAGRIRDTLTACFLGLSVMGCVVLAVAGEGGAFPHALVLTGLAAVVVVGHVAGRPVFVRLAHGHYEAVLTAVLCVSAVAGLLVALL